MSCKNLDIPYLDRSVFVAHASSMDAYLGPEMLAYMEPWR